MFTSSNCSIRLSLALCCVLIMSAAQATLPALGGMRVLGKGEMRWFGIRLYEASLLTPQGQPFDWSRPFALQLRYARDISSQQLVQASDEELQRYGVAPQQRAAWRAGMQQAFPDVRAGDVIIGSFDGRVTRFWHNGSATAQLDDVQFGRQFFRIWLDDASREPGLRRLLLNEPS